MLMKCDLAWSATGADARVQQYVQAAKGGRHHQSYLAGRQGRHRSLLRRSQDADGQDPCIAADDGAQHSGDQLLPDAARDRRRTAV